MYSPLQMAADLPENYMRLPMRFSSLKMWQLIGMIVVFEAEPGAYLTVAHKAKKTGKWFVGSVGAMNHVHQTLYLIFENGKKYTQFRCP
jgi:hypothetical protein